jgi:putative tryptophan/tyrosine transport system substrate-binding protein
MSHSHQPIGLLGALILAAMLLHQDAAGQARAASIAYVGTSAEAEDAGYARFKEALHRAWPSTVTPPVLRHLDGGSSQEQLLQALDVAMTARPSALVVPTAAGALASTPIRQGTPTVFASSPDPVLHGIVESLRRPGYGITGVSLFDELHLKRLELLKDAFPRINTVAVLLDRPMLADLDMPRLQAEAAQRLGLQLITREADTLEELDALMNAASAAQIDAWYVPASYIAYVAQDRIIAGLRRLLRPSIHATPGEVAAGALMAYSQDGRFAYEAMARLAVRIALGEDAGTIPIQRPYRYTLSVRIEPDAPWARIEPSVVRRADRVHRP